MSYMSGQPPNANTEARRQQKIATILNRQGRGNGTQSSKANGSKVVNHKNDNKWDIDVNQVSSDDESSATESSDEETPGNNERRPRRNQPRHSHPKPNSSQKYGRSKPESAKMSETQKRDYALQLQTQMLSNDHPQRSSRSRIQRPLTPTSDSQSDGSDSSDEDLGINALNSRPIPSSRHNPPQSNFRHYSDKPRPQSRDYHNSSDQPQRQSQRTHRNAPDSDHRSPPKSMPTAAPKVAPLYKSSQSTTPSKSSQNGRLNYAGAVTVKSSNEPSPSSKFGRNSTEKSPKSHQLPQIPNRPIKQQLLKDAMVNSRSFYPTNPTIAHPNPNPNPNQNHDSKRRNNELSSSVMSPSSRGAQAALHMPMASPPNNTVAPVSSTVRVAQHPPMTVLLAQSSTPGGNPNSSAPPQNTSVSVSGGVPPPPRQPAAAPVRTFSHKYHPSPALFSMQSVPKRDPPKPLSSIANIMGFAPPPSNPNPKPNPPSYTPQMAPGGDSVNARASSFASFNAPQQSAQFSGYGMPPMQPPSSTGYAATNMYQNSVPNPAFSAAPNFRYSNTSAPYYGVPTHNGGAANLVSTPMTGAYASQPIPTLNPAANAFGNGNPNSNFVQSPIVTNNPYSASSYAPPFKNDSHTGVRRDTQPNGIIRVFGWYLPVTTDEIDECCWQFSNNQCSKGAECPWRHWDSVEKFDLKTHWRPKGFEFSDDYNVNIRFERLDRTPLGPTQTVATDVSNGNAIGQYSKSSSPPLLTSFTKLESKNTVDSKSSEVPLTTTNVDSPKTATSPTITKSKAEPQSKAEATDEPKDTKDDRKDGSIIKGESPVAPGDPRDLSAKILLSPSREQSETEESSDKDVLLSELNAWESQLSSAAGGVFKATDIISKIKEIISKVQSS